MDIVIIRYNAGNTESVTNALLRLGVEAEVSDDHNRIRKADKVIFPGVGEAATTMKRLRERGLDSLIVSLTQPVLGICLGLQLLCRHSEEGDTPCLGIFDETVKRFVLSPENIHSAKVPHMGWNTITGLTGRLFSKDMENRFVYFVHSYYATTGQHTAATGNYINPFSAALEKGNFFATQFHPEKSGSTGAAILENFLRL